MSELPVIVIWQNCLSGQCCANKQLKKLEQLSLLSDVAELPVCGGRTACAIYLAESPVCGQCANDLAELHVPVISWQNCLSVDSAVPVMLQTCLWVEERASHLAAEFSVPVISQNCISLDSSVTVIWQNCLYVEEPELPELSIA